VPTLISIIVPVYNEEANIDRTYRELKRVTSAIEGCEFEFIFTDNHSTDRTWDALVKLARDDPSVRVARFARNFGFHKSVLTGYRLARGAAAIQIDADLQDSPNLFPAFIEKWREGHDVVVGVRRKRIEPYWLRQGRKFYYRLLVRLDGAHLIPDAGDFRLIDASIIRSLRRINDAHPYLRGLISSLARNQVGIEYDRSERVYGQSKFPILRLIQLGSQGIFAHSRLPLKLAFFTGLIVAALAVAATVIFIISRAYFPDMWPPGLATTHILLLAGIGLNGLFLGVIGAYIGRIYDQVRQRPTTVISHTVNFGETPENLDDLANGGDQPCAFEERHSVS
jgi:polyisoprenyl-phosphate glycosyltransferase